MPEYSITVKLELSKIENDIMMKVIGGTDNKVDKDVLQRLSHASILEYIDMITNQGIPSRIQDLKKKRLFYLIENYFDKTLPNEQDIVSLFRENQKSANTLIVHTLSTYQHQLNNIIEDSIHKVMQDFKQDENSKDYEGIIESKALLDKINETIIVEKPGLEKLKKKPSTAGKYLCKQDTYDYLKEKLDRDREV